MKPLEAVETLVAAFQKEITPETMGIYAASLADIDPALLGEAIRQLIASAKFFPVVSEIRRTAARIAGLLPPAPGEILALIRRADVREAKTRRDGSFAYVERYWHWPEDAKPEAVALCEAVLRKSGEPCDEDGNDIFGWDNAARGVYETELPMLEAKAIADLSTNRLLAGRKRIALPPERMEADHPDSLVASIAHGIGERMRLTDGEKGVVMP